MPVWMLSLILLLLAGCETAKYRSWQEGSEYFKQQKPSVHDRQAQSPAKLEGEDALSGMSDSVTKATSDHCQFPYKVQNGDTLSELTERCDLAQAALIEANDLYPPYHLTIGQVLVKIDSGLPKVSLKDKVAQSQMTWPTHSNLAYAFVKDNKNRHSLKIQGAIGEPVFAVAAGEVVYAGNGLKQFGNLVIIKHEQGFLSVYAHNNRLLVQEKQRVSQGQMIATLGRTGQVSQPELYIEMRYRGHKTDAKELLTPDRVPQTP